VSVWTGTQWKGYVEPVFGASYFRQDFNGGFPYGWTGYGGTDGTQFGLGNWSDVHIYVDTISGWVYPPGGFMRFAGPVEFQVKGGQTVHFEASLVKHLVAGTNSYGAGSQMNVYAKFNGSLVSAQVLFAADNSNWGWGVVRTAGFTVPGTVDTLQTLTLTELEINHTHTFDSMGAAVGQYRVYMDWCRVVDAAGNELLRLTANAVHGIKVWNGSAWV
jgi:hypothetical protein